MLVYDAYNEAELSEVTDTIYSGEIIVSDAWDGDRYSVLIAGTKEKVADFTVQRDQEVYVITRDKESEDDTSDVSQADEKDDELQTDEKYEL